ncbi:hypothetical protein DXG01_007543 [Tephrocybe rancida]|nr:hypothetical protein DXG01_007543 [Tephrocybe rancida]
MEHSNIIDAALPFPSQTVPTLKTSPLLSRDLPVSSQQTDYGEDISQLILLVPLDVDTEESLASEPPTSTTPSLETIHKRKLGDLSNSSLEVPPTKKRKIAKPISNCPSQPYIIAHYKLIQNHADISSGVLFELARLITRGAVALEDITLQDLSLLRGKNAQSAPKTARILLPESGSETTPDPAFAQETAATSPWEELDKEEEALAQDPYAGLGHSDLVPGWYGGKIDFRGKLQKDGDNSYKVKLDHCTIGASCRFSRRFGSTSILRIRISDKILHASNNGLGDFFRKAFVLWGNVFRAFYAKEGSVFLFKTNEGMVDDEILPHQYHGLSLWEFIQFHNPLEYVPNQNQGMSKWAARMALGLSNSVPGPLLEEENILCGDDIISLEGSDMTDGCATANRATSLAVSKTIDPDSHSVAFQYRLKGNKGMALELSETNSTGPLKVIGRPSQIKIRYPPGHHDPLDPTLRIVEVLRLSYMRSPSSISAETIINLAENGVPSSVFIELLKANLHEIVAELTTWEGKDAMYNLWTQVERAGAVLHSRRAREAVGEARARGFASYSSESDDADEDDEDMGQARSTAWWADQTSGCPSSLEETVLVLLDAGFRPQDSPIVREKLKQVVRGAVHNRTVKYRYTLTQSAIAFVVPDHCNVLGPDEIHVKSSGRKFTTQDGILTDLILGDVLLTRNPCKLPTDVRKVRAVEHPLLRSYTDVIVCSVQGHRRLLDFLAGGDYDGDTATVIWTPDIVEHFQNADEKYSKEPEGLNLCFSSDSNEKVVEFLNRTSTSSHLEKALAIQVYLLGALRNPSIVGHYSTMHDNAVYHFGYSHPRTIKLAYKFCKVLDGAKSGLRIRSETYESDQRDYNTTRVMWKEPPPDKNETPHYTERANLPYTRRGTTHHIQAKEKFIMDALLRASKKERDRVLANMEESRLFGPLGVVTDSHLSQPWDDAVKASKKGDPRVAQAMQDDLTKIKHHVEFVYQEYKANRKIGDKPFNKAAIEARQDVLRKMSKLLTSHPTPDEMEVHTDTALIARLRASYAFIHDLRQNSRGIYPWSRFPWDLAMRELCLIKANALGPSKTVTNGFYERFRLSRR